MSDVLIIWVSLVFIARHAEGGDWNGHIHRSWRGIIEILTFLTRACKKNIFCHHFVLQSRKNSLREVLGPAHFIWMISDGQCWPLNGRVPSSQVAF